MGGLSNGVRGIRETAGILSVRMALPRQESLFDTAAFEEFQQQKRLLRDICEQRYRVPSADVNDLLNDVFLAFASHREQIGDPYEWLILATCDASRDYLRSKGRGAELADE